MGERFTVSLLKSITATLIMLVWFLPCALLRLLSVILIGVGGLLIVIEKMITEHYPTPPKRLMYWAQRWWEKADR